MPDDLAGAKEFLARTANSVPKKRSPLAGGPRDIDLPNDTGEKDLTIPARLAAKRDVASPRSMRENVSLRRNLTGRR